MSKTAAKQASKSAAKPAKATKARDHVFLVDGSSYIFRAYFAMFKAAQSRGRAFTRSDGLPVGAVMTFCNMLWKLMREGIDSVKPSHIAVVFDAAGDGFRNEIYPEYKANRDDAPDDLIPQFPLMREAVKAFGLVPIELANYEADDLIATYAGAALAAGADVTIVAGDKDLMQLIRPGVKMYDPMPGRERWIGSKEVEEKFGVPPEKVAEVQSLAGDSTDNVPGVPGIGVKTAAQLINEYGDLETLLKRASEIKQDKRRQSLIEFAEQARVSKRLVLLDDKAPVQLKLDDFVVDHTIDAKQLIAFLKAMEFNSLTKRVAEACEANAEEIMPDARLAPGGAGAKAVVSEQPASRAKEDKSDRKQTGGRAGPDHNVGRDDARRAGRRARTGSEVDQVRPLALRDGAGPETARCLDREGEGGASRRDRYRDLLARSHVRRSGRRVARDCTERGLLHPDHAYRRGPWSVQ